MGKAAVSSKRKKPNKQKAARVARGERQALEALAHKRQPFEPLLREVVAAVLHAAFAWGPFGLRAEYERLVRDGTARMASSARPQNITEADLAALPPLVQRYLRFAGVVGTPRVQGFRARMTGRIRGSATAPWMPFVAEQHNFYDPARRFFWMEATRGGLPLDGLHAYGEEGASMRVRLLSLFPVAGAAGPGFTRTETVTLLNDMCIMAPAALLDAAIRWREIDGNL